MKCSKCGCEITDETPEYIEAQVEHWGDAIHRSSLACAEALLQALSPYAAHLDDCELTPCTCGLFDVLARLTPQQ